MAKIWIEAPGLDIDIKIEGGDEGLRGMNLYTRAIVHLIENADTDGWAKATDDYTAADRFRAAVLTALARHYVTDSPMWEEDQQLGVPKLIEWLLEELGHNSPAPFPPLTLGLDEDGEDENEDEDEDEDEPLPDAPSGI